MIHVVLACLPGTVLATQELGIWQRFKTSFPGFVWGRLYSYGLHRTVAVSESFWKSGFIPGVDLTILNVIDAAGNPVKVEAKWYSTVIKTILVIPRLLAFIPAFLLNVILSGKYLNLDTLNMVIRIEGFLLDAFTIAGGALSCRWLYHKFISPEAPQPVEDKSFSGKVKKFVSTPFGKLAAGLAVAGAVGGGAYAVYRYKQSKTADVSDDSGSKYLPQGKHGAKSGKALKKGGSGYVLYIVIAIVILVIIGAVVFFTCSSSDTVEEQIQDNF